MDFSRVFSMVIIAIDQLKSIEFTRAMEELQSIK